jgi:hypothetical protein
LLSITCSLLPSSWEGGRSEGEAAGFYTDFPFDSLDKLDFFEMLDIFRWGQWPNNHHLPFSLVASWIIPVSAVVFAVLFFRTQ